MHVERVDTTQPRDVRHFVRFPFDLYSDCAEWVPPLISDVRLALDVRRNPFYRHSEAAFYVVESERRILGRIGVFDHRRYNDYHRSADAFFTFFDAVNDTAVSRQLFGAATAWARGRGLNRMIGPKGLLRGDGLGLLIEGFEHRPAMGIPYNHSYYDALLQDSGFEREIDYLSGHLSGDHELAPRFYELADTVKARRGYGIKRFSSKQELRDWVPAIKRISNEAFSEVWGYYPADDAEIDAIAGRLISIADPRLIKLVVRGEDVIGFLFAYPDLSEGLQKARGRLLPVGWIHLLRAARRTHWLNINGLGLLPKYQGLGATVVLYTELAKSVREGNVAHADIAQVADTNVKSLNEMGSLGVEWYKRHRIYRLAL